VNIAGVSKGASEKNLHHRGFTRTIGSQKAKTATRWYVEGEVIHGFEITVGFPGVADRDRNGRTHG
jgi:hypothetical protein